MKQSNDLNELFASLAKAQGAFKPIYKNKTMKIPGRPDYQYADLAEIIKTVQPDLSAHGLSVLQPLDMDDKGPLLITRLSHSSGQWIETVLPLGSYTKHQEFGVEVSYKRRYALCSILNIMADDDVDGHIETSKPNTIPPIQAKPLSAFVDKTKINALPDDPAKRLISEEEWKVTALKLKETFNLDKTGIEAFIMKVTGKTAPRTLNHGDLALLEEEMNLKQLDKALL